MLQDCDSLDADSQRVVGCNLPSTGDSRPAVFRFNTSREFSRIRERRMNSDQPARAHPALWVPTLYFAEGLPFFAVSLLAGILYKRLGIANDVIALYTSWLLLPWSLKPLWSPLLEMFKTKKFFVILMEFIGGLSLALVALCLPLPGFFRYTLAFFSVATAFTSQACLPRNRLRMPAGRAGFTTWRASAPRGPLSSWPDTWRRARMWRAPGP
jgi:hypothetical protein